MNDEKCTLCPLHKHAKTNKMSGSGPEHPTWLFVGEAPGYNEDKQGEPFVGKYGKGLRAILKQCGFDLNKVGYSNSLRCWPGPGNPTPKSSEIKTCHPFLREEVLQRKPKVLVLLGGVASESVLGQSAITKIRGTIKDSEELGCKIVATFHPGYVARQQTKLKTWIEDLEIARSLGEGGEVGKLHPGWKVAKEIQQIDSVLELVSNWEKVPALDIEYHGEPWDPESKLLMISFAFTPEFSISIPVYKSDSTFSEEERLRILTSIGEALRKRAENGYLVDAYNAQADMGWLKEKFDWVLPRLRHDPYLAEHLLDETYRQPSLDDLSIKYTEYGNYEAEVRRLKTTEPEKYNPSKGGSYDNFPLDLLGPYNAADSAVTLLIDSEQMKTMSKDKNLLWLYENVVVPANWVIAEFHNNGVKIDQKLAAELSDSYPRRIAELLSEMRLSVPAIGVWEEQKIAEQEEEWKEKKKKWQEVEEKRLKEGKKPRKPPKKPKFEAKYNPNSHFHNREIIFEIDKTKPPGEWTDSGEWKVWKTPSGAISLDKNSREQLKDKHPLVPFLEEYAFLGKIYGNYITRLSKTDANGIYHPWFDLTRTKTGRAGSDLQQLPKKSKSKDVKRMIISRWPEGGKLLNVDISQGELRMLAIISRDEKLTEAFIKGGDIHTSIATQVYECAAEDVTKEMRDTCKIVGFGTIYGQGDDALAKILGWPKIKAKSFIRDYFRVYKGADSLIKWLRQAVIKKGYVYNLMGRKRRLPDAQLPPTGRKNLARKSHALRQAVNAPIQSLLHDLMLFAEYKILEAFESYQLRSLLCAEVHDSIIIDVYPGELEIVKTIVKTILENLPFDWLSVPIVADVQAGPNLAELEEI